MKPIKPLGIFGGTFDPIHRGHIHLADQVYQLLHLQAVHVIPCYQPVHRSQPTANPQQRLEMVKLAIKGHPGLEVDEREIERGGPSYMVDTLASIHQEMPTTPLYLIMSTDAFAGFLNWHRWQDILKLTNIIVTTRNDHPALTDNALNKLLKQNQVFTAKELQQYNHGKIFLMNFSQLPISATEIREKLAKGKNPEQLLPKSVSEYIFQQKLYGLK